MNVTKLEPRKTQGIHNHGSVLITPDGEVTISGFEFHGTQLNEAVPLALKWAISRLTKQLDETPDIEIY